MPGARKAYLRALEYIAGEDANTARLVAERVAHSRELIETDSGMGAPAQGGRVRHYPVPRPGHGC